MAGSREIDIDALFTSDKEKTFEFDDTLPSLPVPPLQQTLNKYLDSVKPHLTADEYRQTEFIVQQFASGVGKDLHEKLLQRAKSCRNWLAQWWLDYAYLDFRQPIAPLINFSGPGPYTQHYLPPEPGSQISRVAFVQHYIMQFWKLLRQERLRPDKDRRGERFSMDQYRKLFSTCRIPGLKRDQIHSYFKPESEGQSPRHLVVLCRGRVFSVECLDENEEPLTVPELQKQFQFIRDRCDSLPLGPGIGALTGDNRTSWAQLRSHLIALHPQNYANLELIQSSIMAVALDDSCPTNEDELFWHSLGGDSTNRWFDKSLSMLFYKNGFVASNCDHTPMDAMVLVTSTYFVDLCVLKCKGKWQGSQELRDLQPPQELEFVLDDIIYKGIADAKQVFSKYAKNLQVCTQSSSYGKKFLQQHKLHPDTHVQLALQYTYYRLYKKAAPTYETGTTRKFYRARTETIRSCTPEAIDWSKAMIDPSISNERRFTLYKAAADKHNRLMKEATLSQGCDRHLFGLQIQALEGGYPMPQIYTDTAYTKSGGCGNYILSTSFVGYTSVYGGVVPMCEHGYGSFYKIEANKITIFVSSWKSSGKTDAVKFNRAVQESLKDMEALIKQQSAKTAHL